LLKFLITVIAALILFGFTQTLDSLGELAVNRSLSIQQLRNLNQSPALHSGAGLLALLVTTILAMYKPWGVIRYGRREQNPGIRPDGRAYQHNRGSYVLVGRIGVVLLFLVLHLIGGGPGRH
jgi:hypothetical protein